MIRILLLISLFSFTTQKSFEGKVIKVLDGDTIDVLTEDKETIRVRLNGIDAPETSHRAGEQTQAFGQKAKDFTAWICAGKNVTVVIKDTDRYGRTIGDVHLPGGGLTLNERLVQEGLAWHYKQYSDDPKLAAFEISARKRKAGLWADSNPTPPWEWRKKNKN